MSQKKRFTKEEVQLYTVDRVVGFLSKCIWPGCILGIAALVTIYAIPYLAGRNTDVSVIGLISATFGADEKGKMELAAAAGAIIWAMAERFFRLYKVEKLQNRVKELELRIDPNRSSSGLTPKGLTNPGDK